MRIYGAGNLFFFNVAGKAAGAKYFVFTAKHHQGFCMFDSAATDYDIMSTPFQRDICKELADACHRHEIKLFFYYSQLDWRRTDYFPRGRTGARWRWPRSRRLPPAPGSDHPPGV